MKAIIRSMLRHIGYELVHRNVDPILAEIRAIHENLRLCPGNDLSWADTLSAPAAHACIRSMLRLHQIDLVLDVGANRGQFARLLRRLGYAGDIVSFEPLAKYRSELAVAAAADRRWRIIPLAMGNAVAELDLHVCKDDAFSSLHPVNDIARSRFGDLVAEKHVERVSVRRLDDQWPALSEGRPRNVLLKSDTQGHDLAVLEGATAVLSSTRAIVTEAAFVPLYEQAPLFPQVSSWLAARGFALSGIFPISHHPEDLTLIETDCVFTRPKGTI
jgi:FkbM family methyltransferase